jgi:hypothetical protein
MHYRQKGFATIFVFICMSILAMLAMSVWQTVYWYNQRAGDSLLYHQHKWVVQGLAQASIAWLLKNYSSWQEKQSIILDAQPLLRAFEKDAYDGAITINASLVNITLQKNKKMVMTLSYQFEYDSDTNQINTNNWSYGAS